MLESRELPDCVYTNPASLVVPNSATPKQSLYLSNLDDQKFLRFSIKYLYIFQTSIATEALKRSLSRTLVHYYPLAGRLRKTTQITSDINEDEDDRKLEIDCNAKGAIFAEAFMDITALELLRFSSKPNRSWRKLLYRFEARTFVDVPPLIIQATKLQCGGMVICTAISHCMCDGIGTSQFLHAWAHLTATSSQPPPSPIIHRREFLRPLDPSARGGPRHLNPPYLSSNAGPAEHVQVAPASITFGPAALLRLKRHITPSLKCTAFEALAAHTWRSWARAMNFSLSSTSSSPSSSQVKLLFSVNFRDRISPRVPKGFYGNAFVLGCAQSHVRDLESLNLRHGVTCVQRAKAAVKDDYVRSVLEALEDKTVRTDLFRTLVISQWAKLGLEDVDFGQGKPLHMGTLSCDIYCLFLPVVGDINSIRVLVSLPESVVHKFEYYMNSVDCCLGEDDDRELGLQDKNNNHNIKCT